MLPYAFPSAVASIMAIDRQRLRELIEQEEATYLRTHRKSYELYKQAQTCLLAGVPMHWMVRGRAGTEP